MNKLVIVESPAKARTLYRILGKGYSLKASMGHIRDLPKSRLGVDIANSFAPKYVVPKAKSKVVTELKQAVKNATTVYLATDPDREGEAIAWHLAEVTRSNRKRYRRIVFHEITSEAIKQAFRNPRPINQQLVNAQQTRRILDRLVGYMLSPLLWRKVRKGLSAGRVQSAALRIIVDREREIEQFVPVEYWLIEAELAKKAQEVTPFRATLIGFTDGAKLEIHTQKEADDIVEELNQVSYSVLKVTTKKVTRQPAPPFITSTLQQEAWRRLGFSASHTMAIAQQLYEGLSIGGEGNMGLITYMRTDSTRVARSALAETREFIASKYGTDFLPPHARIFSRSIKRAQEAHEAIRPTRIKREPHLIKAHLTAGQFRLYELIWQRMVTSQMAAAQYDNTNVDIRGKRRAFKADYLLRTATSILSFPGFTILYRNGKDEASRESNKVPLLPPLAKSNELKLLGLFPEQHFTQPPPHFTEATLVKILEQNGIGRPSTYAPIITTIQEREYVAKANGSLKPTELGFIVNDLLSQYFPDIVNIEFTARMEDELDEVAHEKHDWVTVIQDFYTPFEQSVTRASEMMEKVKLPEQPTEEICPQCGKPMLIKIGRYGKFLACSSYPECKYTKSFQIKTGVICPECGSELVERVNKKKRTFYGCSNYPKCRFATNFRPLPQPCPECGSLLTLYRHKWVKCIKCNYKGKLAKTDKPSQD